MQVIIAGRKPSDELQQAIKQCPNVQLVANPTDEALAALVAQAQVHLLPTFQATGMKLKLLHALFAGRHVVVNNAMIAGTQLGPAVTVANTPQEWVSAINRLAQVPFSESDMNNRIDNLKPYNNQLNAMHLAKAMGLDLEH
jgi:NAD(P)-dependent dehydrogenase (short-subunit alcohol dehydrogenase family)